MAMKRRGWAIRLEANRVVKQGADLLCGSAIEVLVS